MSSEVYTQNNDEDNINVEDTSGDKNLQGNEGVSLESADTDFDTSGLDLDFSEYLPQTGGGIAELNTVPATPTQAGIDQNLQDRGFVANDGRVYRTGNEILARDFTDQDPFGYDYASATDQSYRFLSPEQVGVPEGIEAIYGPTERDAFRQDWSEAEFRTPVDYEGTMLSGDEMNLVQTAQDYISNFQLEADRQGFSSIPDYLAAMKQYDPQLFNALTEELNTQAGIWDQYGDQYKFQAALSDADQINVNMSQDDLIRNSMNLLSDFVSAGEITADQAAGLASNPAALVSWLSGGGPGGPGGPVGQGGLGSLNEVFYYSDDAGEERPYMRDETGNPVPYLAENEFVDNEGRVLRFEGNDITVVRDQYEYPDEDTSGTSGTSDTPGTEYASWDTEKKHPFVYDEASESFVPALRDGERRVLTSEGAEIVDENGDVIRVEHSDWREAPSTGIRGIADDGITAADVPVTTDGVYDLAKDIARSLEDVADSYIGPNATLDLAQEFQIGWDRTNPVDDTAIFTSEVDLFPELNLPSVKRVVGYESRQIGARGQNSERVPVYKKFYVGDVGLINSINYEPSSIVTISGKELGGPDKDWQHDQMRALVPGYKGKSARPARILGRGWNDWNFDMFGNQEVQELLFTELVNYSDITGVSLDSIYNTEHEDIGSYDSENPGATFDSEHFMQGDEDSGWDGFSDILQSFVSENALGTVGSNEDHLSQRNLEKFALFSTLVLRPMMKRLEGISDSRQSGVSFDQNTSIPSQYSNQYGAYSVPDYLNEGLELAGATDEGPGILPDTGGFAGGIVSGMAGGGYIGGMDGGMDDTIPASIDGSHAAALSSGEFVVPADVVSHLGDGNNQNGASKLYQLLDQVRTVKTGSVEQPAPFNDGMMSGILGDNYGR